MTEDEYSLIAWLEAQSLEAHNEANGNAWGTPYAHDKLIEAETYNRVLAYLRNTRRNQRPHVGGRI